MRKRPDMRRKQQRKPLLRRVLRSVLALVLLVVLLSVAIVLPFRWIEPPTSAFMLQDASGRVPVLYEWTDWQRLGSAAPMAVVAAEDQKFATHTGFDFASIQDSVMEYREGASLRGASTVTQQVAKNLYLWPGRSLLRKGVEAWLALLIEASWPKKRILEIYLNVAEFGPGLYGIPAASGYYLGKRPADLTNAEAALLAAVLPNPHRLDAGRPSAYVRERQRWILAHVERLQREDWLRLLD